MSSGAHASSTFPFSPSPIFFLYHLLLSNLPTGKEALLWERFFELAPNKATRGHRYKLFKKNRGTIGQRFFSARVVELWNGLDDSTVSVDTVTAFKVKLGKLGY